MSKALIINAHYPSGFSSGSLNGALDITNDVPADGFSESLNAMFTGTNGGDTTATSGSIMNLAPGASDTSMSIGLDTSSVGAKSGTADVNFVSDPNGINSLGTQDLGDQTFTATGNVYLLAQPSVQALLDFGLVLQGSSQTQAITVTNTDVAGTTFQETLKVVGKDA